MAHHLFTATTLLFFAIFQIGANELSKLDHYVPRADVAEKITTCDSVLLIEYQSGICEANIVEVIKDSTQRYHVGQPYSVDQTPCEEEGYRLPDGLLACHSQENRHIVTRAIYDNEIADVREPLSLSLQKIRQKLGVKVPEKDIIIAQQPKQKPTLSDSKKTTSRIQTTTTPIPQHSKTISREEAAKEFIGYLESQDWNACDAVLLVRYDPDNCASGERIDRIFFDKTQQLAVGQPYPHGTNRFCSDLRSSCDDENTIYNMLFCHGGQSPKVNTINVKDNKMPFTDEPVEDFLNRVLNKTPNNNNPIKP